MARVEARVRVLCEQGSRVSEDEHMHQQECMMRVL